MSAYAIFIRDNTLDQQELDTYSEMAAKAHAGHPITALAAYGDLEAKAHRLKGANYRVLLVQGVE
ncbi:hypothetical protein [Pantoea sp.]|uniref:hypothetical protein n=1 Tax=Pantoea sp. TaxID=69393 RepID=UPI002898683D|nr:hypothetical protein [Pantoea sp.]